MSIYLYKEQKQKQGNLLIELVDELLKIYYKIDIVREI